MAVANFTALRVTHTRPVPNEALKVNTEQPRNGSTGRHGCMMLVFTLFIRTPLESTASLLTGSWLTADSCTMVEVYEGEGDSIIFKQ